MSIPEPKVELRLILDEAFEIFGDKSEYVVAAPQYRAAANTAMGWKNSNLQTEMTRLLRRAGVSGWPRLFHSMRASRQTELQREFPLHVVCSWLGNSPRIAKQSYLLVTDEGFSRTLGGKKAKRAAYRPPVLFFHQRGQTSDPLRLGLAPCSIGGHPQCTQPENRH